MKDRAKARRCCSPKDRMVWSGCVSPSSPPNRSATFPRLTYHVPVCRFSECIFGGIVVCASFHARVCVCGYIHIHTYTHTFTYMNKYIYIYICIYIYTYIYIHMYTFVFGINMYMCINRVRNSNMNAYTYINIISIYV